MKLHSSNWLKDIGVIICLALATVVLNWRMLHDGLNGKADLIWHITWLQHFAKQLSEGIWYPRWLAGTNYGYGSPTFVFYPPLVYYLGSLLKFIGLNAEQAIIVLFTLSLFGSGLTFYIYGRDRWGKFAAVVGAIAFMSAPFLAYIYYAVGSLSSAWAIALIPLGWWLTEKALAHPKWLLGLAFFWTALAFTHLPTLLLCLLVWGLHTLCLMIFLGRFWYKIFWLWGAAIVGLGMASLFLLPATLEKSLVNIDSMKQVGGGFRAMMIGSSKLPLLPLRFDSQPPHIFVHQLLAIVTLAIAVGLVYRSKKKAIAEAAYWLGFALLLGFLMLSPSWFVWQLSPTLQRVQAPWRLLSFFSFFGAALFSVVAQEAVKFRKTKQFLVAMVVGLILLVNYSFSHRLARKFPTLHNFGKANIEHLQPVKLAIEEPYSNKLKDVEEYRPLLPNGKPSAKPLPEQPRYQVTQGEAITTIEQWNSYRRSLVINALSPAEVKLRTYYYPAWQLLVNDRPEPIAIAEDGAIAFNLQPGTYRIELEYQSTLAFKAGIAISSIALAIALSFWFIVENY